MALRLFTGSTPDVLAGSGVVAATNTNLSTSFQAGQPFTAPNTTNYATGVLLYLVAAPSSGDIEVDLRESGTSKRTVIANSADLKLGFNYLRFSTAYQFTTTAANAYTAYVRNTSANSGAVGRDTAAVVPFLAVSYDTGSALGATDDVVVCGWHNSGLTTKTWTITGTGNSWGSGTSKNLTTSSVRIFGATTVGNGGTLKFDQAADCTLTQYGNVFVTAGGVYDQRPGSSSVSRLLFTNDADGDFSLAVPSSGVGGQVLTTGKTVSVAATYTGGAGTAASPATFTAAHGFSVGDELVIGWGGDYLKNEIRFVISIPNSTSVVWSSTFGGTESALTYTHATGKPVCNLTRNSIIGNTNNTRGFSLFNWGSQACDYSFTRLEYPNCLSGRGVNPSSSGVATPCDGMVLYNNSANGRTSIGWSGSIPETIQDVVLLNTRGTNFSAQSGFVLAGASNKTVRNLYHYAEPASTTCCAALSVAASSTACAIDGLWSSGANAGNNGGGYAVGVYGSGNTFNNINVDGARQKAVLLEGGQENDFTNSKFGTTNTNVVDILCTAGVFTKARFLACSFGSGTLISGYTGMLPGSDIGFQDLDGNTSKHRWYTPKGSFWSSGSGLTDTTTRTAGSLALAIKPEDATNGAEMIVKVPANPTSQVVFYGYLYRNTTFSTGDLKVELFLPGTLLTAAPDATVTLPTTTGAWLPFTVSAYYPGTVARYANVRITAKTATAGAYAFLDDIWDAQTGNKVAGLDLWDQGHISPIIVAADYSSIPEQTRVAVWSDDNTYAVGAKGKTLADIETLADATQAAVGA